MGSKEFAIAHLFQDQNDILYHLITISDLEILWLLSRTSSKIRKMITNIILEKNILTLQKIVNANKLKEEDYMDYSQTIEYYKKSQVYMKYIIYTLVQNINNSLIFKMKLNNMIFYTQDCISRSSSFIIELEKDNFLEDAIEFEGGRLILGSLIEKREFDRSLIALSKNHPIVLSIVTRLRKYSTLRL